MQKMGEIVVRRRETKRFPPQSIKVQWKMEQRKVLFWSRTRYRKIVGIPKNTFILLNI